MTIFDAPTSSGTFDFTPGDVGYVSNPDAHYIENTGNTTLTYLEVLLAPRFTDISVAQWLGLTPPQVVEDHLSLPKDVIAKLPKTKNYIVPGNRNLLTTNFTNTALASDE